MTQTDIANAGQLPTGEQIYDYLMGQINPELMLANLDKLDDPYQHESETDHRARYQRYQADFAKYDEVYEEWAAKVRVDARDLTRDARKATEEQSRQEESHSLSALEQQIAV